MCIGREMIVMVGIPVPWFAGCLKPEWIFGVCEAARGLAGFVEGLAGSTGDIRGSERRTVPKNAAAKYGIPMGWSG